MEEPKTSASFLLDAFASIGEGVLIFDRDDRLLFANRRFHELYPQLGEVAGAGASPEQILRQAAARGLAEPARGSEEEWVDWSLDVFRNPGQYSEHRRPDGGWTLVNPKRTAGGGTVVVLTDITELKRQETETKKQVEFYVSAIDSLDTGVTIFDKDLIVRALNQCAVEILDFPPEMAQTGYPLADVFRYSARRGDYGSGDVEELVAQRLAVIKCSEPHILNRTRPDGTVIEIRGRPLPGGGFATTYTDVTEPKRQEALIRQAKDAAEDNARRLAETLRQFDVALGNMTHGLILFDAEQRVLVSNRRYAEIFHFPPELLAPGLTVRELVTYQILFGNYADDDAERIFQLRMQHIASRQRELFVERLADGRSIEVIHRPLADGGAVVTYSDISEQELAQRAIQISEESLRQRVAELEDTRSQLERRKEELSDLASDLAHARDEAEGANRAKSSFLANMSHELRTPLNAILGFSEVMMGETFGPVGNDRYRDYLKDIHGSGQHLLEIINDILDLSKIEACRAELREGPLDIDDAIESCQRLIRERAQLAGVTLRVEIAPALPSIRGDELRLKQVLLNLIGNAIKFTPSGGAVTVAVARAPDGGVLIEVTDTGIGMRAEDISIALQPFGQVDSSLARKHEGTGLGLPLSKALVEMHGGSLRVDSKPGAGTTVTVHLPPSRVLAKTSAA